MTLRSLPGFAAVWLFATALALILTPASALGSTVAAKDEAGASAGSDAAPKGVEPPRTLSPDDLTPAERRALEALGYLSATQKAPDHVGVRFYDPDEALDGVNLWVSAHRQVAFLMSMQGEILHEWSFEGTNPRIAFRAELYPGPKLPVYFRRAHLYPNGNLLVQRDFQSMLMLDKNSQLLWEFEDLTHHDIHVTPSGTIYVLTRKWRVVPWLHPKKLVADDEVVKLGPLGREIGRVSVLNAMMKGLQGKLLLEVKTAFERRGDLGSDLIHVNSIDLLQSDPGVKVKEFTPGRLLLSARTIDAVMVLDFAKGKIVWWMQGKFRGQHDARMLASSNMLLFDNLGRIGESAVIELDPATGAELWRYQGTDEAPFQTSCCGTARRLSNGNTLIVETEKGRAFEVTPEKKIVWEFVTPFKVGTYGALMQDLIRLPEDPRANW